MSASILDLQNLSVTFDTPDGPVAAVKGVSFSVAPGECLGVVGESGSGKSQSFLAAFGLLAGNGKAEGSGRLDGQEMLGLARRDLDQVRGKRVAFVFQDPLTALTPHMTIGEQMCEVLAHHFAIKGVEAQFKTKQWLDRVRIPDSIHRLSQYPHELSGGMRQRVMIAMAMMAEPALLIADEPTTALDATVQAQVLDLIDDLRRDTGAAVVLITHDMGVVARMAQRVAVMRHGEVVETGDVDAIFANPQTEYAKMLIQAAPRVDAARAQELPHIEDGPPLLAVDDVRVHFPVRVRGGTFGKIKTLRAVDGVSFKLRKGETLGIVGESGCGKSTLARAVAQLLPRDAGAVSFLGRQLLPSDQEALKRARRDLQFVFQDPLASLDPRMTIGSSIAEPLRNFEPMLDRAGRETRVRDMMTRVGLDASMINRYPHELSGGQNQRVGVARAMIVKPKLVVCDEAVSALDVSIQAQIINLLIGLQREMGLSMLFISHDLGVVREISHSVLVLYLGRAVEQGPAEAILRNPRHPYTQALLAAAPIPDPAAARARPRMALLGDLPSPLDSRAQLRFLKSRVIDDPDVVQYRPQWLEVGPDHFVAEYDAAAPEAA